MPLIAQLCPLVKGPTYIMVLAMDIKIAAISRLTGVLSG